MQIKSLGVALFALWSGLSSAVAQDLPKAVLKPGLPPLIGANDYPAAAKRAGIEGKVRFDLIVDRNGDVERCVVIEGSGSIELDDQTCSLAAARAKFIPAKDATGRATGSRYSSAVNWMLPDDAVSLSTKLSFSIAVNVDKSGLVESCEVSDIAGSLRPGQSTQPIAHCPAIGGRFADNCIAQTEGVPSRFIVTKTIQQVDR